MIYLLALFLYMRGSTVDDAGPYPQQLFRMGFSWLDPPLDDTAVVITAAQSHWFPFGAFTIYALLGPGLIDVMTANPNVRLSARDYLWLLVLAPVVGVFAFSYDGVYIGATWAREMRNLMVLSLLIFLAAWLALRPFGNAGLWGALLVQFTARGLGDLA